MVLLSTSARQLFVHPFVLDVFRRPKMFYDSVLSGDMTLLIPKCALATVAFSLANRNGVL